MNKKVNKKGFTLIELLAVIVVLALIMVIAMPSILNAANSAKKKSFQMYGQRLYESAMGQYESDKLLEQEPQHHYGDKVCYTPVDLGIEDTGTYQGFVVVTPSNELSEGHSATTYNIYLTDGTYAYNNALSTKVLSDTSSDTILTGQTKIDEVNTIVQVESDGVTYKNCK